MNDITHIVLNTDDNYAIPTIVTITSLLHNKNPESQYNIHVLVSGLSADNLERLSSIPNINIIEHTNRFSQKYQGTHKHVSSTDLSKFDFPQIFSDLDKILYIDSDMIVQKDLVDFYHTNIENVYAAVVLDYQAEFKNNHIRIGNKRYFNNGMMLLNLAKMRNDNVSDRLIISKF